MSEASTARFQMPDLIEVGVANTLTLDLFFDGARATDTFTVGTVAIIDPSGVVKYSGAFDSTSGTPTVVLPLGQFSTTDLGASWTVEWTLTALFPIEVYRNEAAIVRRRLFPVVTDLDLFRRASGLDPSGTNPITSLSNYQDFLTEAWISIQLRLINSGDRPNLILSPSALRDVHLFLTLSLIFRDLSTRLNEAYLDHSDRYSDMYEAAWSQLRFKYDTGAEDGISADDLKRGAIPSVWLCGRK